MTHWTTHLPDQH